MTKKPTVVTDDKKQRTTITKLRHELKMSRIYVKVNKKVLERTQREHQQVIERMQIEYGRMQEAVESNRLSAVQFKTLEIELQRSKESRANLVKGIRDREAAVVKQDANELRLQSWHDFLQAQIDRRINDGEKVSKKKKRRVETLGEALRIVIGEYLPDMTATSAHVEVGQVTD